MRMLFTFVGGHGHFEPLAPLARAAAAAGHDVAFACRPSMAAAVESRGFAAFALGTEPGGPPRRRPLRAVDRDREDRHLRDRFVRRAARDRAPRILELAGTWRPDVLVCDETDFGASLAAERLGLPYAAMLVTAAGSFVRAEVVGAALDEIRAEHGLPPDPGLARPAHYLVLSPFPRRLRDPRRPLPPTAHAFRPPPPAPPGGPAPDWATARPGAPTIYFTLGTVFHLESGDLATRVVAGLRELDVDLIATVGPDLDPTELGPQPPHVHVERFVPQEQVLPHCDLVVCHGGSGSVMGALAHGLPMVLIPLGADQPSNALRCAELGAARVLEAMEVTPARVAEAARRVLAEPAYRSNAAALREEIAALPDVANAVALLERLAAERRPIDAV